MSKGRGREEGREREGGKGEGGGRINICIYNFTYMAYTCICKVYNYVHNNKLSSQMRRSVVSPETLPDTQIGVATTGTTKTGRQPAVSFRPTHTANSAVSTNCTSLGKVTSTETFKGGIWSLLCAMY